MYSSTITLSATNYDLNLQNARSSVRSDATAPLGAPRTLTISHETNAKTGLVSSAVLLSDTKVIPVGTTNVTDVAKVYLKLQYNPANGRASLEADIKAMITELVDFVADATNGVAFVDKLLNLES